MLVEKKSSRISARTAWATLHAAGFVVLYHNPFVGTMRVWTWRLAAGDRFFDLAELDLSAVDAEAVEQVRFLAESLRIPAGAENPGKGGLKWKTNFAAENIENLGPNGALNTVLDVRADRPRIA